MEALIPPSKAASEPELSAWTDFEDTQSCTLPESQHLNETTDVVDGRKTGYKRLEMSKERSSSFPIFPQSSVTYRREKKSENVMDEVPKYPRRKQRRIIAIESSV